jgi:cell division protease FtsH
LKESFQKSVSRESSKRFAKSSGFSSSDSLHTEKNDDSEKEQGPPSPYDPDQGSKKRPPLGGGPKKTQPPERKNFSFWLILAAVFSAILVFQVFQTPGKVDIPYGELLRLIDQGAPSENSDPSIVVTNEKTDPPTKIRYSHLDELVIGPYEVSGTVTRQVLAPEEKKTEPREDTHFHTGRQGLSHDDNNLAERLEKNGFRDFRGKSSPSFFELYGSMILMLLIMIPLFIFMFRRFSGAGAMAFGKSRGRQVAQEDIEVTFDDVAGVEEAVEELREVVDFLKTPEKFQLLGGRIPKGVLLVGPPGTGKTLLAKAVAGEAGVPFFSLSGSDFVEMFVGVGAARVRDLFDQAERKSPAIIFIDELDALGKTRSASSYGGHDEREQTLNALLVEMDGFSTNGGTIVMAATNRPETLDPALLRPGRFDRQVLVDRPDLQGREDILKVHTNRVKIDPTITLKEIAMITSGFVGADLAALVNEAALLAARNSQEHVTMDEFTEAVERVTTGLEKRRRIISEEEKQRVAYHESGHALVAYMLPKTDPVHKVSIIPRGLAALGYTLQRPEDERYLMTQTELENRIQVMLGGTLAEEIFFDDFSTGAQNDLERATDIARSMVMEFGMSRLGRVNYRENPRNDYLGEGSMIRSRQHSEKTAWEIDIEIRRIIDELYDRTKEMLEKHARTLETLSLRLLEKEVLDTTELSMTIDLAEKGVSLEEIRKKAETRQRERQAEKERRRAAEEKSEEAAPSTEEDASAEPEKEAVPAESAFEPEASSEDGQPVGDEESAGK